MLYQKHRPKKLKQVIGQAAATRTLLVKIKRKEVPHALLFSGPSGVGKTTLARIVAGKLRCGAADLHEINAADFRGIDTIREIRSRMNLAPLSGACRVYILDEVHKLSGDAQTAILKMLEDTPEHVYFMLATTDPSKLLRTVVTRCTEIRLRELSQDELRDLICFVSRKESFALGEAVEDAIVEQAEGSARMALVLLDKVIGVEGEREQLAAVESGVESAEAIELARAFFKRGVTWSEVASLLSKIDAEPESVRWLVLSYAASILLGRERKDGKRTVNKTMAERADAVIEAFQYDFYQTKKAGLIQAAFRVVGVR